MADTTINVGNSNVSSLHSQLNDVANRLADLSLNITLFPYLKKGIELPDKSNSIKKINLKIKDLLLRIEELNESSITESDVNNVLNQYLKINDFVSKLLNALDNNIVKNKIKSIVRLPDLSNYYTKTQVDNIIDADLSNYYDKSEFNVKLVDYTGDLCNTEETEKVAQNSSEIVLQKFINNLTDNLNLKEVPEITIEGYYLHYDDAVLTLSPNSSANVDIYKVIPNETYRINSYYWGLQSASSKMKLGYYVECDTDSYDEDNPLEFRLAGISQAINTDLPLSSGEYEFELTVPSNVEYIALLRMKPSTAGLGHTNLYKWNDQDKFMHELSEKLIATLNSSLETTSNLNSTFSSYKDGSSVTRFLFKTGPVTFNFANKNLQDTFGISSFLIKYGSTTFTIDDAGGTDLIGPIGIEGYYHNFIGGAHGFKTADGTKYPNYFTDKIEIQIDNENKIGHDINSIGDYILASTPCKKVKIVIYNSIYKPSNAGDVISTSNGKTLVNSFDPNNITKVCTEIQTWTLCDNKATVRVKLHFLTEEVVETYYGMLSRAPGKSNNMTIVTHNGAYDTPTLISNHILLESFTKSEFPNFDSITIKHNLQGNACETIKLNTNVGLGTHKLIKPSDNIFHKEPGTAKLYNVLIKNLTIPADTTLEWEGIYSFFIDTDNEISVPEENMD